MKENSSKKERKRVVQPFRKVNLSAKDPKRLFMFKNSAAKGSFWLLQ
jgi:hypothetical protein